MGSWKEGKKQAEHLLGVVVSGRKVCARFVDRGARGVFGSYSISLSLKNFRCKNTGLKARCALNRCEMQIFMWFCV